MRIAGADDLLELPHPASEGHVAGHRPLPVGSLARVEFSEDLQQWTVAGNVTLTGGVGQFQEIVGPGNSHRFYRLKKF